MGNCEDVFVDYFGKALPELSETYQWKIPSIEGFAWSGEKGYQPNVELKWFLNGKWHNAAAEAKLPCAKEIVADWGGVRGNKESTLRRYIAEIAKESPAMPFAGIASYSKIYAVAYPKKFAIYDARVAACLNAVQYQYGVKDGKAFNYCNGRNNAIGNVNTKQGFVYSKPFLKKSLIANGWQNIKRDDTYREYLNLLHQCLTKFPDHKLYDLEMILFANAERECKAAMKSANG